MFEVLNWFNDIFLKMVWLEQFISWLFVAVFGLTEGSSLHAVLTFFIYDTIKIFVLLSILIFLVSYIQSYFSPERTRSLLKPLKGLWGNIAGALLGTLTPFCSCSSIPIFIGFTKAGLPIGITFSLLISSPLVDLASVILLASIFSWPVALLYVFVGLLIAIGGGTLMQVLNMERYLASFLKTPLPTNQVDHEQTMTRRDRIQFAFDQLIDVLHRVYPYVLLGVGIGALIHGVIPQSWIEYLLGQDKWYAVPLATLLGTPMYADIFGTLPIGESLLLKGVGIGTILSFMMSVTALSLPSLIMLKKVMKQQLWYLFIFYLISSIMLMGLTFNILGIQI